MKIVAVTWNDAHGGDGRWKELATEYEPCIVVTIGYLQEFEGGVIVTSSLCETMPEVGQQCFAVTHIPRGCIVSIENLGRNSED